MKLLKTTQDHMVIAMLRKVAETPPAIQSLIDKSSRFRQAWDEMQKTFENTEEHHGESSSEHTSAVLSAIEKIWASDLPKARIELAQLVAALHDVGKPATRTVDPDGKVRFIGHAKKSAELAKEILEEIGDEQAELAHSIVVLHMDLFAALADPNAVEAMAKKDTLWKMEGAYAMIEYMIAMTRADLASIDSPQATKMDALVQTLKAKRAEVEAARKAKQEQSEALKRMTPDEFVQSFRGNPAQLPKALKGKYPNLSPEEIARLT